VNSPTPILVDTSVWSLALRRRRKDLSNAERAIVMTLEDLIRDGQTIIIGPVRLEILSGIDDEQFFRKIRDYLREFDDEPVTLEDYEEAARLYNLCARAGVASSPNDLVICAVALRLNIPVFTLDGDFTRYARIVPLQLPSARQLSKGNWN
jgi:predicted nucleic acid-binding protein